MKADFIANFEQEKRAGFGGHLCVINMPAMSATSSSSRFYVLWLARTGRSVSPGITRRGTMDARTDGISNGATKRRGVYSMKSFTAALPTLPERSIAALEQAAIWPKGALFHREPMPSRLERSAWGMHKRSALDGANIVFLDPDNGVGAETEKHATFTEIRLLRKPGRAIVFITFPGSEPEA